MIERIFGIGTALAETTAATEGAGMEGNAIAQLISLILPMALIFAVFYFMMIRPQRKKDKQVQDMLNNLKKDDRICTIGGIYGTIVSLKDDTVTIAVGNQNMPMVIARWAVRSVEDIKIENDGDTLN